MLEFNEYLEFAQAHCFATLFDRNDQSLDQHSIERLLERTTARPIGVARYSYAIPDATALTILAEHGPIIEIGAGTGYWAYLLRQRGVDVVAFDINPPLTEGHTNRYHKNELIVGITWTEVLIGGPELVAHYPDRSLFLCWPPPREPMAADALAAYKGSTLIFIGEWNPDTAASIQFYDALEGWQLKITHKIPRWFGMKDRLSVWRR
jgi:hypothetical protein